MFFIGVTAILRFITWVVLVVLVVLAAVAIAAVEALLLSHGVFQQAWGRQTAWQQLRRPRRGAQSKSAGRPASVYSQPALGGDVEKNVEWMDEQELGREGTLI